MGVMRSPALLPSLLLSLIWPAVGQAQVPATQTLPAGFELREGNASTSFPLNTSGVHRWHWVYDSGQFAASGPIAITRIDFRPDGGSVAWNQVQYQNFEVSLGAANADYRVGNYSSTFDANWASGTGSPHVFYGGVLLVPPSSGSSAPNSWSVALDGDPFLYDPSLGQDFIIDVRTPGAGGGNPLLHSLDCASASPGMNGGNRYGNTASATATLATFASNELVPIVRIHYLPATGLFASFAASPRVGTNPLVVNFNDTSFTSDPAGIQSWAWDLDGDGMVDSNSQFPSFTYTTCGNYDVKLTITDTLHPAASSTRSSYIQVDPQRLLQPNFSSAPIAPLQLAFTDASFGNPLTWDWDLDGDGTVDSQAQSPTFLYPAPGPYNARLIVSNACGSASIVRTVFAVANDECVDAIPLQRGLNGPFDSRGATTSLPTLCNFGGADLWFTYTASCSAVVRVDTCVNPTLDTVLAVWDAGCAAPALLACDDDTCGLQSEVNNLNVFAGQQLWISVGAFQGAAGAFYLSIQEVPSGTGSFATAFPGCGTLQLTATGTPVLGGAVSYDLSGVQALPFVNLGLYSLGVPICAAGCVLGTTLEGTYSGTGLNIPVPCDPTLRGGVIYTQGFDLGANGGCAANDPTLIALSETIVTTIG